MRAQLRPGVIDVVILGSRRVRLPDDQPKAAVTAVVGIRGERAQESGRQVGAQPYADCVRMLKEPKLDLAIIATPDPPA